MHNDKRLSKILNISIHISAKTFRKVPQHQEDDKNIWWPEGLGWSPFMALWCQEVSSIIEHSGHFSYKSDTITQSIHASKSALAV